MITHTRQDKNKHTKDRNITKSLQIICYISCLAHLQLKITDSDSRQAFGDVIPSGHGHGYRWFSIGLAKVYQPVNVYQLDNNVD